MPGLSIDVQYMLDQSIGGSVLREMYEEDGSAELKVLVDDGGVHVALFSDTQPIIAPADDLLLAVGQLIDAHERAGSGFSQAVYQYRKQLSGQWAMTSRFTYAR